MKLFVANAARMVQEAMARALKPPPPVDYLAWAVENIVFTKRESPHPGPYNRALFPYFDEILRAMSPDDPCRIVTVCKSAQLGGTVLANIFTLGSLAMDPGDFMYNHPTIDNAQRWSKMKLAPMLKATTALARLFPQKSRDGSDSVLYKERVDGQGAILVSGANSPASLSMVTVQRQVQDDLAKWEMNAAGDPESQADTRSQAHEFAKIVKISTPMVMPGCRITKSMLAGSQEVPEVPCPHCDHFQSLEWENMLALLDEAEPEKAGFSCVECGALIEEHHRPAMLARWRWKARNPKMMRFHRSFGEFWSAYSVLQSWERIARAWFKAKGDPASEQTFLNDVVGRAYQATGEAVPWETLRDRAAESHYPKGKVPAGGLLIVAGVDCQGDRVEVQIVAYTRDGRRFVIDYMVYQGHISDPKCQAQLDALMVQSWVNAHGRRLQLDMLAIDGNAYTEDVWSWARKWPASRVIMVRGANSDHAPLLQRVKRERGAQGQLLKYSRRFYTFGTSVLKLALYRNLQKTDPLERGHVGFPTGLDDEYFRQLTAERRKPVKRRDGFTVHQWVKDPAQANEGLDTHLQAEAAAIRLGARNLPDALWDELEQEREKPPEASQLDLEDLMMTTATPASEPAAAPEQNANPVRMDETTADWIVIEEEWM